MSLADYDQWKAREPDPNADDTVVVEVELEERPALHAFRVEINGYDSWTCLAENRPKARYRAYRAFREAFDPGMTFGDFIARGVRVREAP